MPFQHRSSCPLCAAGGTGVLFSTPYSGPDLTGFLASYYQSRLPLDTVQGIDYVLNRCHRCRFVWQPNCLDPVAAQRLYSEWISPADSLAAKNRAGVAVYSGYARQLEALPGRLGKPAHEIRVLDFGMGWGRWCQMALALGFDACGIEASPERVRHARERGIPAFADVPSLGEQRFDFINAEQVFEHLDDPLGVLRQLAGLLGPGGLVRISVPNATPDLKRARRGGWRPAKNALQPLEHINCFTNSTLKFLGRQAGLVAARQPFLPGQGLLGKSFRRGLAPYLKSLVGVPYRSWFGTTLWFERA